MTLRSRVQKLEGKRGHGLSPILIVKRIVKAAGTPGIAVVAKLTDFKNNIQINRQPGETKGEFEKRIDVFGS